MIPFSKVYSVDLQGETKNGQISTIQKITENVNVLI